MLPYPAEAKNWWRWYTGGLHKTVAVGHKSDGLQFHLKNDNT